MFWMTAGIMPHCLDPGTATKMTVVSFDGQKWEESMTEHSQRPKQNWIRFYIKEHIFQQHLFKNWRQRQNCNALCSPSPHTCMIMLASWLCSCDKKSPANVQRGASIHKARNQKFIFAKNIYIRVDYVCDDCIYFLDQINIFTSVFRNAGFRNIYFWTS